MQVFYKFGIKLLSPTESWMLWSFSINAFDVYKDLVAGSIFSQFDLLYLGVRGGGNTLLLSVPRSKGK